MQVTAYKTVDVECEVDIDDDHIIDAFRQRLSESSETYYRRLAVALHHITRILADVKPEVIAAFPEVGRKEMHNRLSAEVKRWET